LPKHTMVQDILSALYQWSSFGNSPHKDKNETSQKSMAEKQRQRIVICCLEVLQYASKSQVSLEILVAHLGHWDSAIADAAALAIVAVLNRASTIAGSLARKNKKSPRKSSKKNWSSVEKAKHDLLNEFEFGSTLLSEELDGSRGNSNKDTQLALRRRALWVLLEIRDNFLKSHETDTMKNDDLSRQSQAVAETCLFLVASKAEKDTWKKKDSQRKQLLKDAWQSCIRKIPCENLSKLLLSLANSKEKVYATIAQALVKTTAENVTDTNAAAVSVYSVITEAALHSDASSIATMRLIHFAVTYIKEESVDSKKHPALWLCIVPALALLEHKDEGVRSAVLTLLAQIRDELTSQHSNHKWKALAFVCQEAAKNKNLATMGGNSLLSNCLRAAVKASSDCRACLLELVLSAALTCGSENVTSTDEMTKSAWLPFGRADGLTHAAVVVLRAMELAGESAFPLRMRWSAVGSPILNCFMKSDCKDPSLSQGLVLLSDVLVGMLKGLSVADANALSDTFVISMGRTSAGRRHRSYSIGKGDAVSYIDPYPESLSTALVQILGYQNGNKAWENLQQSVLEHVLSRATWANSIFRKLPVDRKRAIANELLGMLASSTRHVSIDCFLCLPLDAADIDQLKELTKKGPNELAAISILSDYIRSNHQRLASTPGFTELLNNLFSLLAALSSVKVEENDEIEYVRQSLLAANLDLLSHQGGADQKLKVSKKTVSEWVGFLLALNGNETKTKEIRVLGTQRAKGVALSLLTSLCSSFPMTVVSSLIPAMTAQIQSTETSASDESTAEMLRSVFDSILPVYWEHASVSGLSFTNLLHAFVESVQSISSATKRKSIYNCFIHALAKCHFANYDDPSMGAVIAFFFAGELKSKPSLKDNLADNVQGLTEFALEILEDTTGSMQVSSILLLLHYADALLLMLGSKQEAESQTSFDASNSFLPTADDLLSLALGRKITKSMGAKTHLVVKKLVHVILLAVNDILLTESVRKFIRRSDRNNTTLSLRLWQDLLVLQSTASLTAAKTNEDENDNYWETTIRLAGESLDHIQTSMPLPTFLASATSLIKEGETDDLKAGAIRLVADRAPEVRPGTPEAQLFLDMASMLVDFLDEESSVLRQSALVAIEHIARGYYTTSSSSKRIPGKANKPFMSALQGCTDIFVQICGQGDQLSIDVAACEDDTRKLLCSAALCSATLVCVTGPRCIALLPKFMNQIVACLESANRLISSADDREAEIVGDFRLIQVCCLRALASVADNVSQFIYPYLKVLLAPSALPSGALRSEPTDHAVIFAADALEKSLSAHVPARVILPVVSKSISSVENPAEFEVLLKLMQYSIEASSGEELVGHLGALLGAVTTTYDFDTCDHKTRLRLLDSANRAVLALVMKLSENHLRRLYSSLREWRGSLQLDDPDKFAMRRFAFWKVSAVLGKELRALFLPCLTSVLSDAVEELVSTTVRLGFVLLIHINFSYSIAYIIMFPLQSEFCGISIL